jgi:hypothetical protein
MKISEIRDTLKAEVLVGHDQMESTVVAGGGAGDGRCASAVAGRCPLTGLTTRAGLATAKVAGVTVVVFVRGKRPDDR